MQSLFRIRVLVAISFLWAIVAIPTSTYLNREFLDAGMLMPIFAYFCVLSPIWIFFGGVWVSGRRLQTSMTASICLIYLVFFAYLDRQVSFIPLFCMVVFLALSFIGSGISAKNELGKLSNTSEKHSRLIGAAVFALILLGSFFLYNRIGDINRERAEIAANPVSTAEPKLNEFDEILEKEAASQKPYLYKKSELEGAVTLLVFSNRYAKLTKLQQKLLLDGADEILIKDSGFVAGVDQTDEENIASVRVQLEKNPQSSVERALIFKLPVKAAAQLTLQSRVTVVGKLDEYIDLRLFTHAHLSKINFMD